MAPFAPAFKRVLAAIGHLHRAVVFEVHDAGAGSAVGLGSPAAPLTPFACAAAHRAWALEPSTSTGLQTAGGARCCSVSGRAAPLADWPARHRQVQTAAGWHAPRCMLGLHFTLAVTTHFSSTPAYLQCRLQWAAEAVAAAWSGTRAGGYRASIAKLRIAGQHANCSMPTLHLALALPSLTMLDVAAGSNCSTNMPAHLPCPPVAGDAYPARRPHPLHGAASGQQPAGHCRRRWLHPALAPAAAAALHAGAARRRAGRLLGGAWRQHHRLLLHPLRPLPGQCGQGRHGAPVAGVSSGAAGGAAAACSIPGLCSGGRCRAAGGTRRYMCSGQLGARTSAPEPAQPASLPAVLLAAGCGFQGRQLAGAVNAGNSSSRLSSCGVAAQRNHSTTPTASP